MRNVKKFGTFRSFLILFKQKKSWDILVLFNLAVGRFEDFNLATTIPIITLFEFDKKSSNNSTIFSTHILMVGSPDCQSFQIQLKHPEVERQIINI